VRTSGGRSQPTISVMPLPRALARFNRRVTNRVLGPLAHAIPPFAEVEHRGRKSGRTYRTPVWVFPTARGYVIALTYGPATEWVRNVLTAGECLIRTPSGAVPIGNARLLHGDEGLALTPAPVRQVLRLLAVRDFLALDR
jgi:deazaflavin-dependent oxidoreductase (nitroreductase family)